MITNIATVGHNDNDDDDDDDDDNNSTTFTKRCNAVRGYRGADETGSQTVNRNQYIMFIRHYSQQNTTQIKEKKKKGQTDRYIQ